MPFQEVHVLTGTILKGALQLKVSLSVPNANFVVHACSSHQLAIMIELNELHSLSMPRKFLMLDSTDLDKSALFLHFLCLLLHLLLDDPPYKCLIVTVS